LQEGDADDLTQEVFGSVARAVERGAFDRAKGSFRGWLFRVARNRLLNHLTRPGRHTRGTGDTDFAHFLEAQQAPPPATPGRRRGCGPGADAEGDRPPVALAASASAAAADRPGGAPAGAGPPPADGRLTARHEGRWASVAGGVDGP
jgi:DNA-directed RNA polymerase specialized sigma24 family protein